MGETVHECIYERVRFLKQKQLNKRKKQVLRNRVHLDSLNSLHEKYVLVPDDKAANNVIVVCKIYYLDVVIKEFNSTKTYVNNDSVNVVSRHLDYMVKKGIDVSPDRKCYHLFTGCLKYMKHHMALDSYSRSQRNLSKSFFIIYCLWQKLPLYLPPFTC